MTVPVPTRAARWRRRAIEALILIIVIVGIRVWQQRDVVSGAAPSLAGTLLDGTAYKLSPQRPVLVHFWATWCPVCSAEQGSIQSIAQGDYEVVTVAMQSGSPADVARHMAEQRLDFPVLNDADGRISAAWGVHAVPASFIVDRDGQIRFVEIGYTTEIGLRLRLWLAGW
ncbi:MAG: protein disulfide oxidoreductase [Gallionella sp.]|jgi:peroxiredoxin|nr:protein disulfide oxidoreductase [Gallionella sp.]MCK9353658.1 protein disulfide oxidoreductase [Gallionella sp.]